MGPSEWMAAFSLAHEGGNSMQFFIPSSRKELMSYLIIPFRFLNRTGTEIKWKRHKLLSPFSPPVFFFSTISNVFSLSSLLYLGYRGRCIDFCDPVRSRRAHAPKKNSWDPRHGRCFPSNSLWGAKLNLLFFPTAGTSWLGRVWNGWGGSTRFSFLPLSFPF